jgi:peptidoglycan/LPS O-acetylase OafA/YrhL
MKLKSIQFLRAVAALLVVYEHSMDVQISYGVSKQQNFYHLDNFGCIGVDLFFVISGFIITYVANKYNGVSQGIHFLTKRFVRINPVYYIATGLCLGLYILQLQVYNISFAKDFNKSMSSLMDAILVVPPSGDINKFKPLLILGWTLSFEWLFYAFFFILILCNVKRKTLFLPGLLLILIILGQLLKPSDLRLQFLTNPIMLEFILGVIICQWYVYSEKIPVFIGTACLSIGIIGYMLLTRFGFGNVYYYLSTIDGTNSINRVLLWGIPSSCVVAGCIILEKNGRLYRLWNNQWALLGGNASYSIYLLHYTVFGLLMLLYTKTGFFLPSDVMIWFQMIVVTAISIGFYKLVEKPLLRYMHNSSLWNISLTIKAKQTPDKARQLGDQIEPVATTNNKLQTTN